jgi:hypothetical protein
MFQKTVSRFLAAVIPVAFSWALMAHAAAQSDQPRKGVATDAADRIRNEKLTKAQNTIDSVFSDSKSLTNPVLRIKLRMLVADAYWDFKQEKAREILLEDFPRIEQIMLPESRTDFGRIWSVEANGTYKGITLSQVRAHLRKEMLAIATGADPALARALLATEKKTEKRSEVDEVLAAAGDLATYDPELAARILKEAGSRARIDDMFPFMLARLRDSSPAHASEIFDQVFSNVKARGDLWDFELLLPYILPSEQDRLIGGRAYLTASNRLKDTIGVLDYGAQLLYRRIQTEAPINTNPELVTREFYIWQNLSPLFSELKPDALWLVNTRLRQLGGPSQPVSSSPGSTEDELEERTEKLVRAAESAIGQKRDSYLNSAAFAVWRFGKGDFDRAAALAEKIDNLEQRDLTMSQLYFQAGIKFLGSKGPEYSLSLARKINLPGPRTRLYLAIISSFGSLNASERIDVLHDDLLSWLRGREKNSDTAWAVLDYLDGASGDSAERKFEAFNVLVHVLNSADVYPPQSNPLHRVFWYPEFHDFKKSVKQLVAWDFDRTIEMSQMLTNKEVAMQIQAAICIDYLKTQRQSKQVPIRR